MLKSVRFPSSLRSIGESAFSRCDALGVAILPDGLTSIESLSFYGCVDYASIPGSLLDLQGSPCDSDGFLNIRGGIDDFDRLFKQIYAPGYEHRGIVFCPPDVYEKADSLIDNYQQAVFVCLEPPSSFLAVPLDEQSMLSDIEKMLASKNWLLSHESVENQIKELLGRDSTSFDSPSQFEADLDLTSYMRAALKSEQNVFVITNWLFRINETIRYCEGSREAYRRVAYRSAERYQRYRGIDAWLGDVKNKETIARQHNVEPTLSNMVPLVRRLREENLSQFRSECFTDSVLNDLSAQLEADKLETVEQLRKAVHIRESLYSLDIVFPKYRNLAAIATMSEYLETGRCEGLKGPDGAYNLYESEMRANRVIDQLDEVNRNLKQIMSNQYLLYQSFEDMSQTLDRVGMDLISSVGALHETVHDVGETASRIEADVSSIKIDVNDIKGSSAAAAYFAKKNADAANAARGFIAFSF